MVIGKVHMDQMSQLQSLMWPRLTKEMPVVRLTRVACVSDMINQLNEG